MIALLAIAIAEPVTLTEADYRRYVTESRQLDACRDRQAGHLEQLDAATDVAMGLRSRLLACAAESRAAEAEDAEALQRSERRRGRLRTALLGIGAALVGALLGAAAS